MKRLVLSISLFFISFFCVDLLSADLLSCSIFMDGFFEIEVKSEKTREDGTKLEISRETKVGKDSLIFEVDSGEGNSVVFIINPKEDGMVVFSAKNVEKGIQYFYTGIVSGMGELFAFGW